MRRSTVWAALLALSTAACGASGESSPPSMAASVDAPVSTPIPTVPPSPTLPPTLAPTTVPTSATERIFDGLGFLKRYDTWHAANSETMPMTELLTEYEAFARGFEGIETLEVAQLYNAFFTEDLLANDFAAVQGSRYSTWSGGCVDLVQWMVIANNAGIEGAIELAFNVEATCEAKAVATSGIALDDPNGGLRWYLAASLHGR